MKITPEHIEKYQALYFRDYGKVIDQETARKEVAALVTLLSVVHKFCERERWPDVLG